MILTDQFVLLNYPRTGSTFVREALGSIYGQSARRLQWLLPAKRKFRELLLPINRTTAALESGRRSQHGCYSQIPASHRGKPVLCVTRNPLERVVSQYEHGFW